MYPVVVTALVMYVLTVALYFISSMSKEDDTPKYPRYVFAVECFLATALFMYAGMIYEEVQIQWYTWIFFIIAVSIMGLLCYGGMFYFGLILGSLILVPLSFIKLFILEGVLGYEITVTHLEPYFDSRYTAYKVKWAVITALNVISFVVLSIPIIQRLIE